MAILNHLYLNHCWWKALGICSEGIWIRAIFFMGLDGRKDIQSAQLAWWTVYCALNPSFLHSRRIIKSGKRTNTSTSDCFHIHMFYCDFNRFLIDWLHWDCYFSHICDIIMGGSNDSLSQSKQLYVVLNFKYNTIFDASSILEEICKFLF